MMSHKSIWQDETQFPVFDKLHDSKKTEVCIVGGGITGITAAYLLSRKGVKVILIDADRIAGATTGHTTAKVTAQHGLIYAELMESLGKEQASAYYQAMQEAMKFIHTEIETQQITCDYEQKDAFLYTNDDDYIEQLEKEKRAYDILSIPGEIVKEIPFDMLPVKQALRMEKQAQFNPLKYLKFLLQEAVKNGVEVHEQTVAMHVERNKHNAVITKDGHRIICNYVIAATHFPFIDHEGAYFSRMYAERSYVIAVKSPVEKLEGMYLNIENPTRSLRTMRYKDEDYLLIGGENHRAKGGEDESDYYLRLQQFAKDNFNVQEAAFQWSAQDLITLDKMPYIGPITKGDPSILVATGYRKWGMTNGTLAAQLLADTIMRNDERSAFRKLFSPARFYSNPMIKNFIGFNSEVAAELVKGVFDLSAPRSVDHLNAGEATITHQKGKRVGVYKDEKQTLYAVDTTCTHMGCKTHWNGADKTWNCPCHGSRFHYDGKVLEGPAKEPLRKINLDD